MSFFVGIDVGGTTSTVAIGNDRREVVRISDQFATRAIEGPTATIEDIAVNLEKELKQLGGSLSDVSSTVIATPGPATLDGVLRPSPNLRHPEWVNCGIREQLQTRLSRDGGPVPVWYLGDGQAAALGEYVVRTKKLAWPSAPPLDPNDHQPDNLESLFFVAVGTGLGGGEVADGKVVRGCEGRAGHAGHLFLPHDAFRYDHDRQLKVGNALSTAESAISLTALTHQLEYRLALPQWKEHPLNFQEGTIKDKARKLREYAAAGDALSIQLFDDQAAALGIAMLVVNYIGDLGLLVIGGGVCDLSAEMRERYARIAEESYKKHALDGFRNLPGFAFSQCGDQASVIGALAEAYETAQASA
ncbi:ROK family protein [Novipirellula artificiosorum]|uniref:Glucokinase n=1 Tax=Novipirellula artificiosorum TaxID=2528016 RepID=A0A5C6E0U9_9BACT|nr:ROK family protein [Novipirellula artificiosorum]TWU42512.1 Glucokinase [Novipirellula artificiosorum]